MDKYLQRPPKISKARERSLGEDSHRKQKYPSRKREEPGGTRTGQKPGSIWKKS